MNLNLSNLPGAFGETETKPDMESGVSEIDANLLDEFAGHPYSVNDDEAMDDLVESIQRIGIATPLLVRPADGRYQIISGHRRVHAARIIGLDRVPAVVRDMDDDTAVITMVDSNKSRPNIPLSEQAKAMLMRHDAIMHQGSRGETGETSRQQLSRENEMGEKTVARLVQLGEAQAKTIRSLDEQQAEELDPGTIAAACAVERKPKTKEYVRVPREWIPAGMDDDDAIEWIHRAINEYSK